MIFYTFLSNLILIDFSRYKKRIEIIMVMSIPMKSWRGEGKKILGTYCIFRIELTVVIIFLFYFKFKEPQEQPYLISYGWHCNEQTEERKKKKREKTKSLKLN